MPSRTKTPTSPKAAIRCEGLIVEVGTEGLSASKALALAKRVAKEQLSGSWTVRRFAGQTRTFEIFPASGRQRTVGRYWECAALLNEHRDVVDAEPALVLPGIDPAPDQVMTSRALAQKPKSFGGSAPLSCSTEADWSLDFCSVPEAWAASPAGRRHGRGIRIAHPDTGYTRHPDFFDPARILVAEGFDFEDGNQDPRDELVGKAPGHGSATGSVILSDLGPDVTPHVTGVAPAAELVPLRVSTSVVHLSFRKLAKAIHFAADKPEAERPHVLSMSLGGPFKARYLRKALRKAIERGIIPIAAAGNVWPFVVYPARYREILAIAACNCRGRPWSKSAAGGTVDLSAPGESVWRARVRENGDFEVGPSDGTSYATAMTAGACALWLAHHGYDSLVARYGRANLAAVFGETLRQTVVAPAGWDPDRFGAGILDAEKLLAAPLPLTAPALVTAKAAGPMSDLGEYFPGVAPSSLRRAVRQVLQAGDQELEPGLQVIGDELEFHVATNPDFRARIAALCSRAKAKQLPKSSPAPSKLLGKAASKALLGRMTSGAGPSGGGA